MNYNNLVGDLTLSIVKPDAIKRNLSGAIRHRLENASFRVVGAKLIKMTNEMAASFYEIHKDKSFFNDMCKFMSDGPCVVQVLYKKGKAVKAYRDIMGATNPADALAGTLRHDFGISIDFNAVHGSDSDENAMKEIEFFFNENEIFLPEDSKA
jgi:nucleoside-diphosphate kinase